MKTVFDILEIQKCLLHRYPFILIDRVVEFEDAQSITAIKNVTANENYFQGHFPGNPVMPGVLILEAMAQAAAMLSMKSEGFAKPGSGFYLVGADDVKWKRKVTPGDSLVIKVKLEKRRGHFMYFEGEVYIDDKLAAKGKLSAATES